MLTLDEIRERLSDRALHIVADRIGVHRKTLYNIMAGKGANYKTLEKLSNYLTSEDK